MQRSGRSHVLIAGGGVAALEAALALRALAEDRVSVELLAPEPHFWYRPLAVAEPFALGEVRHFELDGLAHSIGADVTPGGLVAIDAVRRIAHASNNAEIEYDQLLIACGALPIPAIPGALTFRGPADIEKIEDLLEEIEGGSVRSVAFAIPWGAVWSLPAYELALLTTAHLERRGVPAIEVTVVTPDEEPLQIFGSPASEAVRDLLAERGVTLRLGAYSKDVADGALRLIPQGWVAADRVVALPRLQGVPIDGIPQTVHGFVPVDAHCRVHGVADVYAAGDITSFTIKQGGIATQQADVAAQAIAAAAGADVVPERFRPVLRGVLLTGQLPRYLRRDLSTEPDREPVASIDALWWPPAKIVGRYLAPFLAEAAGMEGPAEPSPEAGLAVEVELEEGVAGSRPDQLLQSALRKAPGESGVAKVGDVMSVDPLVVAPEDTLGEVAEMMRRRDVGSAVVAEYGRLIGILTSRDMLDVLAGRVHSSEARVRQWMTAEPIAVSAETTLEAAAILMTEHDIHHLPVVDGDRPVGMVGLRDVVRSAASGTRGTT
jgi:sulfide:quinone oxidoreductase